MVTKHFFKTLVVFVLMISFGLLGVFLVNQFEQKRESGQKQLDKMGVGIEVVK